MLFNIRHYSILFFLISNCLIVLGQEPISSEIEQDSLSLNLEEATLPDSLNTTAADTLPKQSSQVPLSKDALDIQVTYGARDTHWYDHQEKQVHLFGEAYVNYGSMALTAGYIVFNLEENEAEAFAIEDEKGHQVQLPKFKDGDQEFTYEQLRYNFKTKKGLVYQAVTTFTDLYVLGAKTKFVGTDPNAGREEDVIYNDNALITSCNHEEPHFGIRTKKLKVIPKKVGVTGPAQLELGGVPTPLWLPFGFFPLTDGRSTGLIFPKNFPYRDELGFGVEGIGWYFPINDFMDLQLTADYFTRGTWGANSVFRYKKRYKYNGNLNFSFRDTYNQNDFTLEDNRTRSLSLNYSHKQDSKAHPYQTIGGSINFSTNNHNARTNYDFQNRFNNQYSSNFYYTHSLPGLPYTFDFGLRHNQNAQTGVLNVTLPDIKLNLRTVQPFKRKKQVGNERWYELINVSGKSSMVNLIESTDSTFFQPETWDNMRSGVRHDYNANASFKLLKYFSVNPRVTYQENWVFQTVNNIYDVAKDSTLTDKVNGFDSYRSWTAGADMNTALFGMIPASKGWFRGMRHTMKPRVGYTYNPDLERRYVDSLFLPDGRYVERSRFSRFDNGPFGNPRFAPEAQSISYGISNILEMKYYSRKLEDEKKVQLISRFDISGNYNFLADTLKWSVISVSGNTNIIKGVSSLRWNFGFDPYLQDSTNVRINQFVSSNKRWPVRLDNGNITLSSNVSIRQLFDVFRGEEAEDEEEPESTDLPAQRNEFDPPPDQLQEKREYVPTFPTWEELIGNFRINHNLVYGISSRNNQDTIQLRTHTVGIQGNLDITDKWSIGIGNIGYDFVGKELTYPYVTFTRQLHCWNMSFNWAPNDNAFGFFIGVSNGTLEFLKYRTGDNNIPNFSGGSRR